MEGRKEGNNEGMSCKASPVKDNEEKSKEGKGERKEGKGRKENPKLEPAP